MEQKTLYQYLEEAKNSVQKLKGTKLMSQYADGFICAIKKAMSILTIEQAESLVIE